MHPKNLFFALTAVVALQLAVLAGEYLSAVYPLWTGTEVTLKTVPIDPRSLFRGNYAELNYDISTVSKIDLGRGDDLRVGERIYVRLKAHPDGWYEADGASLERPSDGLFIRGRIQHTWHDDQTCFVVYGIEAYFAPKEKALALEKTLQNGGLARIMIAGNGRATLKSVEGLP